MSRLSNLVRQLEKLEPRLAADIAAEVKTLSERRAFGLNFERHVPETVELPGRPVRRGDKVRFLADRGTGSRSIGQRIWRVQTVRREGDRRFALLVGQEGHGTPVEAIERSVDDLVVVAEFRDPIFPGLISIGKVERGGNKPFHSVINAENFHALQTLLYTHEGKVDVIYIDPPYNTGARDWKYNNDYVDTDDLYRHSKWLAFVERRLLLAKRLLNPDSSALIVTIDEREYMRLGMLLQQTFPDAQMQMISTVINSKGTGRANEFRRVDEYIFFLLFGEMKLGRLLSESQLDVIAETDPQDQLDDDLDDDTDIVPGDGHPATESAVGIDWQTFRRRDLASRRGTKKGGPRQFYPIYVSTESGEIEAVGDPLPHDASRDDAPARTGCVAVFPLRKDGTEMNWSAIGPTFEGRWRAGYARAGRHTPDQPQEYIIQYLKSGTIRDIESGRALVRGRNPDGSVIAEYESEIQRTPTTQWAFKSHSAEHYGTGILNTLVPGRTFPFPKSLYAVEDALRLFVADKPDACIVDFFAGSGTTAHAVMRLNHADGGRRVSISVTNNEVSADEQERLTERGLRPGDREWEQLGICEHITKPRLEAAITGVDATGKRISASYKFEDEFPMGEGLEENIEFFTMTYEAPRAVAHSRSFEAIAPLLWLRAGARGQVIRQPTFDYAFADAYAVLFDLDAFGAFISAVAISDQIDVAFIVTDDERAYQMVCAELPVHVEPVRLYSSYLNNFQINTETR